jgi:hypothetical protein
MVNALHKFVCLSKIERKILIRGLIAVVFFQIIVQFVPLKHYFKWLINSKIDEYATEVKIDSIKLVIKTLKRIEKILRFELSCLIRSLTLKYLFTCININSKIELEISKIGSTLVAHSYVVANEHYVLYKKKGFIKLSSA